LRELDSVIMDIDRLVSSIEDMMPHELLMSSKRCIFKTPVILFRHNKKAYIPDAFSIGPLHHGSPNLKATEKIKAKYLQGLISRSPFPDTLMLRTLIRSIMEVEKEARECYAEAVNYNPEELVKILVIDGCFIIELFRKKTCQELIEEDDPIFTESCMLQFLWHDFILLENQVPWMVIEILFNLTKFSNCDKPLILLAANFLESFLFQRLTYSRVGIWMTTTLPSMNIKGIKHFLDLVRKLSTSFIEEKRESIVQWELLPSATRLVEAGIKFKRGAYGSRLEVKFIDGVLEIPPFQIDDVTETVFRNLISYEQCHPKCEARITSYAILLDNLINTAKDIDILCKNQIIHNWLNPEDAAQLFNKLYRDTYLEHFYYTNLCKQVNSFCKRRWPRWRAVFVRNYFNTPWAFLSTLAAVCLLVMTLLQTLYTIGGRDGSKNLY
ncbi:UPF0481 protein At3g47200-like, partial [Corylus avellana]|uniref:UPF0481 protein At3g47200-like n=1 Tax=Corylus avellana TaxID=13451 RepID=UPI00286B11AD